MQHKVEHGEPTKHTTASERDPFATSAIRYATALAMSTKGTDAQSTRPHRRSQVLIEAVVEKLRGGRSGGSGSSHEQPSNPAKRHSLVARTTRFDSEDASPKRKNYLIKAPPPVRKITSDSLTAQEACVVSVRVPNTQIEPRASRTRRLSSLLRGVGGGSSPTQVLPNDGATPPAQSRSSLSVGRRKSFRSGGREPKALSSSSAEPRNEMASLSTSNVESFKDSFEEEISSFRKRKSSYAASSEDYDQERRSDVNEGKSTIKTLVRWHLKALGKKGPTDRGSLLDSMLEQRMADSKPPDEVQVEDLEQSEER